MDDNIFNKFQIGRHQQNNLKMIINNYSVIYLLQDDVMNDNYDWVKELCDAIEEIKMATKL